MPNVPKYNIIRFHKSKNQYCVFVFVLNEGERFLKQMKRMQYLSNTIDIIIVDGGSDNINEQIDILTDLDVNCILVKDDFGGLSAQMRIAFDWGLKNNYKGFITIDGNGKDKIDDIIYFLKKLKKGYDHIQGSRFIKGGSHKNTPFDRLLAIKLIHAPLISLFSGFHYTDTTNGFRAYSKKFICDANLNIFREIFIDYELHYYLAIQAPKLNYKTIELPVCRVYPESGLIPTKINTLKSKIKLLITLIKVCLGFYNQKT